MRSTAIALATLALLAAGCGSANNNNSSTTTGKATSFQSFVAAAFAYSRCMRSHGDASFPDPHVINSPGRQGIGIQAVGSSSQFKTANQACKGLMPNPGNANPAQAAAQRRARGAAILAFARCLRGHGVSSFPDPTSDGSITPQMLQSAGVDLRAPSFLTAARTCVGVTHGVITFAQVEQAIQHLSSSNGQ